MIPPTGLFFQLSLNAIWALHELKIARVELLTASENPERNQRWAIRTPTSYSLTRSRTGCLINLERGICSSHRFRFLIGKPTGTSNMKKFIAIALASSLAIAAGIAAPNDAKSKKAAPKTKAVQHQPGPKPQHVNARTNTHVQSVHQQRTANTHTPNVQHSKITKQQYHKPTTVQSNNVVQSRNVTPKTKSTHHPTVQSNQLPAVQKNQKTVVNQHNAANIQRIRAQHQNFHAKPNQSIASAQFNQNYRIRNAQNWSGAHYRAFQTYRPQWHDQGYWRSHYGSNLLLIGGGWYFWNSGYWYPAWGYDSADSYYPYDGPIYVGQNRVPFDRVVADVQATLQEQGYYRGEVDGLMGPLTRTALSDFQRDHGLITTAALDQPTLASLGLG
jgi:hypothetical protein